MSYRNGFDSPVRLRLDCHEARPAGQAGPSTTNRKERAHAMSKKSRLERLLRLIGRICAMWACFISCLFAQTFRLDPASATISFVEPGLFPPVILETEKLDGQFTLVHDGSIPGGERFTVASFVLLTESGKSFILESVPPVQDPIRAATGSPGSFLVDFSSGLAVPSVVLRGSGVDLEEGYQGFSIQHHPDLVDGTFSGSPATPRSF